MPYQIKIEGDQQVVYNLETDKKEGSYDNRASAMKRMKELYAAEKKNEGKPAKEEKPKADDEEDEE